MNERLIEAFNKLVTETNLTAGEVCDAAVEIILEQAKSKYATPDFRVTLVALLDATAMEIIHYKDKS